MSRHGHPPEAPAGRHVRSEHEWCWELRLFAIYLLITGIGLFLITAWCVETLIHY